MEWVETTGRTVEGALDAALDELGVDEDEVEFEVLQAPRVGILGRREARIRARVRPISREKPGNRKRRPDRGGATAARGDGSGAGRTRAGGSGRGAGSKATGSGGSRRGGRGRTGAVERPGSRQSSIESKTGEAKVSEIDVSVEEQARSAEEFTRALMEAFGADAGVAARIEDDAVLVDVTGEDLGLLVGPKGATLAAIEELVRTVVQRRTEGHGTRIKVDVGGYRARRREALTSFVEELAQRVTESGQEIALEPMSPADRKVVHDALAPLEGVTTVSEGEEPRRRVVVRPA